jgi:hypothetical protein
LLLSVTAHAGLPQEIWPLQPAATAIKARLMDANTLEPELGPAVQFQRVFSDILDGSPPDKWRGDLEGLLKPATTDVIAQGVAEIVRVWLARAHMAEVDAALKNYYRQHVAFPDTLTPVLKVLPANLRVDPWGQPWVYTLHAPEGFSRQPNQRYQLGPTRCPLLTSLRDAIKTRPPQSTPWKITAPTMSKERALLFKTPKTAALIQPGGAVDGCRLLFIGDRWALLAGQDQLFSVAF